jgi:hypothetical protein
MRPMFNCERDDWVAVARPCSVTGERDEFAPCQCTLWVTRKTIRSQPKQDFCLLLPEADNSGAIGQSAQ